MQFNPTLRADWFPNTVLAPEFAEGTVPLVNNVENGLWAVQRTPTYGGPEWMTVIANRDFTEGCHYFEVKVVKYCRFMVSLLFPFDETLITGSNLASYPGSAANPLFSENYTSFYSGTESIARYVRNIHDMKIDDNMTPYRDALLAAGISRDRFNGMAHDMYRIYTLRDNIDAQRVQQFLINQRQWDSVARHHAPATTPPPVFDWAGCRVGFLMDLDQGLLYLLVYFPGNHSTSYKEANKRVLFAVLGRGRRYFPAISMAGCEGALELRTSTEVPAGYGDVAGQLQEARAQVAADRAAMAAMDAQLEALAAELQALRAQV
jgi:hypothetical protein